MVCVVVGDERPFSVEIDPGMLVDALKDEIKKKKMYDFPSDGLQLFMAMEGLSKDAAKELPLDGRGQPLGCIIMDEILKINNTMHFGMDFQPQEGKVYVLNVLPKGAVRTLTLWVVKGSVENALEGKGVRARLYQLAHSNIAYYDPNYAHAFTYDGKKLMFHVVVKSEDNAQFFEAKFLDEIHTFGSPLYNLKVLSNVDKVSRPSNVSTLRRVKFSDYQPSDSDSLQETMSPTSALSDVAYLDQSTELFQYQRLEDIQMFPCAAKAEKARLMSKEHCEKYESYTKYKHDPNNFLALSRDMHGWFDALNTDFPFFKVDVVSWEEKPSRYKVLLKVTVANYECKDTVFGRLKEGSQKTSDALTMNTFVYVENPKTFQICLEWKSQEIEKDWDCYFSMQSAVA
ncbi:unnamed protein product [Aphanomyces euteiches]|uniref:Crinkler effector protein N-terminal domain-containing protein n=1 Tax=Aphanomyces euteiches TaxID=100861 RepID=A0A6G0X3T2_9STRA|nr:hypothetical protein Ae201684_008925 [Aphanomyces euteiches]KAF0734461.1 hypothetical protein Ae201684_008920 [Aphanomyces euteiches]